MTVVWTKDGRALPSDLSYTTMQMLRDGMSATYDNLLMVSGHYSELVGIYSCIVHDSLGRNSVPASLQVNGNANCMAHCLELKNYCLCIGLEISGYDGQLTVGEYATITCSFDLELTSIEWIYNGDVISLSSSSQLPLFFSPVNDSVHDRQYTCRAITEHGRQEKNITIFVQGIVHTNL